MAAKQPIASYSDFLKALLSDRERFFEEVVDGVALRHKLRSAVVTIVAFAGFFGFVAGAYSGPAQAVSAGVKLPFRTIVTWTDGQNTLALNDVRPNVPIDAAKFTRPAPFKRR